MITTKHVLTATTVLGIFGLGWFIAPDAMGKYWQMIPAEHFNYMGSRYGVLLIGLAVTVWLGRDVLNTKGRRALMMGAFVSLTLTTSLSLYGAVALELNAWPAVIVELLLTLGLAWVLFIKPEPLV